MERCGRGQIGGMERCGRGQNGVVEVNMGEWNGVVEVKTGEWNGVVEVPRGLEWWSTVAHNGVESEGMLAEFKPFQVYLFIDAIRDAYLSFFFIARLHTFLKSV